MHDGKGHQCDLCDLSSLREYNNDYTFLLTNIDVFSRQACAIPIKSKTASDVVQALEGKGLKATLETSSARGDEVRARLRVEVS